MAEHEVTTTPELEASLRRGLADAAAGKVSEYELNDQGMVELACPGGPTLTAGELVEALQKLDPNTPLVAYGNKCDYVNVVGLDYAPDQGPAAVLALSHDYDSRQW